jgi:hypothetical protein
MIRERENERRTVEESFKFNTNIQEVAEMVSCEDCGDSEQTEEDKNEERPRGTGKRDAWP